MEMTMARNVPAVQTAQFVFRLPDALDAKLRAIAEHRGTTRSGALRLLIKGARLPRTAA